METDKSVIMSKEEEEEMESLVRQRRRSSTIYQGTPPTKLDAGTSGLSEPNMTKTDGRILRHSARLRVGFADTIGRRPTMEDEITICGKLRGKDDEDYVGIFDGHGGKDAADFASKNLHTFLIEQLNKTGDPIISLKQAFILTHEKLTSQNVTGGSTALVALFFKSKCYIANAGDCRAVLQKNKKTIQITVDHKPDHPEEEKRIVSKGGVVTKQTNKLGKTISRVNGMLAVSRALGDGFLSPYVTPEPQVDSFDIGSKDDVLVLACDGVWDVIDNDTAVGIAGSEDNPEQAALKLRDTATAKQSTDNISAVIIRFTNSASTSSSGEPTASVPATPATTHSNTTVAKSAALLGGASLLVFGILQLFNVWRANNQQFFG